MKFQAAFALVALCAALLRGQTPTQAAPAGAAAQPQPDAAQAQPPLDPRSDSGEFAPWRVQFGSGKITFLQVKYLFLYQNVIVGGTVEDLGSSSQLLDWRIAEQTPESMSASNDKTPHPPRYFVPHAMEGLSVRYSGKKANVIAIQLHTPDAASAAKKPLNAMGEPISDDDIINPCFDVVVRFPDGTTAMTTQYPASIANAMLAEPMTVIDAAADRLQQELPEIVGTSIYAAGFTPLYKPNTTIDEMVNQVDARRIAPADVPLFVPLPIVAARYVDAVGVVIEVLFPNGDRAISLTSMSQLFLPPLNGKQQSFLECVIGLFLPEIPRKLTRKEVSAIKSGSIYSGMSENALEYVMGFPDKQTDAEDSGRKLTFRNSLVVVINYSGRVESWKFLN